MSDAVDWKCVKHIQAALFKASPLWHRQTPQTPHTEYDLLWVPESSRLFWGKLWGKLGRPAFAQLITEGGGAAAAVQAGIHVPLCGPGNRWKSMVAALCFATAPFWITSSLFLSAIWKANCTVKKMINGAFTVYQGSANPVSLYRIDSRHFSTFADRICCCAAGACETGRREALSSFVTATFRFQIQNRLMMISKKVLWWENKPAVFEGIAGLRRKLNSLQSTQFWLLLQFQSRYDQSWLQIVSQSASEIQFDWNNN